MTDAPAPVESIPEAAQEAFDAGAREFVQGNTSAAIEHFTRSLAASPDFDSALYLLALANLRTGARDDALQQLDRVAERSANAMLRDMARGKLASLASA